ncbi:MAG: hypothetical protein ACYDB6_12245 [Candidatus Limnocylindrales bacterium]
MVCLVVAIGGCGPTAVAPIGSGGAAPQSSSPVSGPTLEPYSPAPSGPPEDPAVVYARIEGQVVQIRGLAALAPVSPKILDAAGLAAELRASFDEENPPAVIAGEQALYRDLGLFPRDRSLKDELLRLLVSQVAGFYRPTTKELYVISQTGAIGPSQKVTFAHEFDHALQDQHFGLTKLGIDTVGQSDRSIARLSLAEGDATLLMSDWAQQALTPVETLQLLQESVNPAQTAVLASMPPFLRDQLLFPYTSGLPFVESLWAKGGWPAVDAAYAMPPDSTKQILHPELYLAHAAPIAVAIPADLSTRLGPGWAVSYQDTLGEFGLQEWLRIAGGLASPTATAAATGWGGDRVVVVEGPPVTGPGASSSASPSGASSARWGVAIVSRWDTQSAADAFATAARTAAGKLGHGDIVQSSPDSVTVVLGSDDAATGRLAAALRTP